MTSSAQLPIIPQQRDISLGRWVVSATILFPLLFVGLLLVAGFFASAVPSVEVAKAIVLASALCATVIPLLPGIRAGQSKFLARLWRVTRFVMIIEGLCLVVSVAWCLGDGPKSLAFLGSRLWFVHVVVGFLVVTHVDYLFTGNAPEYGGSDDDDWLSQNDDNGVNVDGSPMCGGVDIHGNAYGFTSTHYDDE